MESEWSAGVTSLSSWPTILAPGSITAGSLRIAMTLERHLSAYSLVGTMLAPITSEEEIQTGGGPRNGTRAPSGSFGPGLPELNERIH